MSNLLLIPMPSNEAFSERLARIAATEIGSLELRHFPDAESHIRIAANVSERSTALVCTLDRPDSKLLPLLFAADAIRDLGATRIGLIAPYLAYMRQDRRFESGEAVTSSSFARLLSGSFDWLLTVDPHLHRYKSLTEIYSIPARVVHSGPAIADWILHNVVNPLLVGPDAESEQWVSEVARLCGAPFTVMEKIRRGDRDVDVRFRDPLPAGAIPVLIDDIVSTGETLLAALNAVCRHTSERPIAIAVHGIFAGDAFQRLNATGARVITSNSISHQSNAIDLTPLIAKALPSPPVSREG